MPNPLEAMDMPYPDDICDGSGVIYDDADDVPCPEVHCNGDGVIYEDDGTENTSDKVCPCRL